jgi:hypothetical protein
MSRQACSWICPYAAPAFRRVTGLAAALALTACVHVERTLPDGTVERVPRAELPAYAQSVFKRRNAVSTQFLLRTPEIADDDAASAAQLDAAEQRMDEACAPVDALAIAYRDGQHVGLQAKLKLAHALEACSAATSAAEQALADALPRK